MKVKAVVAAALPLVAAQNSTNSTGPSSPSDPLWGASSPPKYPSPWGEGLGDWESAYSQAATFVSGLTLLEKVNLTTGVGWQSEKCVGNVGSIPRLGFKSLCMQDSPLGVRFADFVSAFESGVTAAATWDRKRIYERGVAMGTEHRLKGVDVQLGPVVGPLGRSPEGGRNWEGFSPDPVLSAVAVEQSVKGIQSAGIMACTKHYILNEQEHFRQGPPPSSLTAAISSNIDDVTMHELYLWPFAEAVRAGTASIMCSYNQINNSYGCQNSYTQNYLLKNELGFQGFIMSDWGAHHSGVGSALAGMDMSMPGDIGFNSGNSFWGANLTASVLNGSVPTWRLDDMTIRIVAGWYYVDREGNQVDDAPNFSSWTKDTYGFQHPYAMEGYTQVNYHVDATQDHGKGIRERAAAGTVLLKNNGILPLSGTEKLTSVFGSDAGENQYGPNGCPDHGCDNGTLAMGWGSGTADFPYLVTPLEAIKARVIGSGHGFIESVIDDYAYTQVTALARRTAQVNNSVCIAFANSDSGEGYIVVDGNEGDRNNLTLWHNGNYLIENITAECPNTIVVLHTVGPVLVDSFYQNPNVSAIIWAGLPGQQSGNSIADVLYGDVNPGGKTPFTWGPTRESYGTDLIYEPNNGVNAPQDDFEEGVFIDYRAFDRAGIDPIYEFGFGLSYTTFEYSNLQIQAVGASAYQPASGNTPSAPTYGTVSNRTADYLCPEGFHFVYGYIYPCLNSTSLVDATQDPQYGINHTYPDGAYDSSPQPRVPAGGAPGGNPRLWDVLFRVTATVTNNGSVAGDEVAQLYVSLGGPNDPKVVLRNFDRIGIQPGASETFTAEITRKDLSNWDPVSQDWYISNYPKTAYVGSSSRKLPLSGQLVISGSSGTPPPSYSSTSSSSPPAGYSSSSTLASSYASVSSTSTSHGPPGYSPTSYGSPGGGHHGPPSRRGPYRYAQK
ncbi:glycoside hydrolase family 3 protein [Polychaeton citri CBS 116435]|uniref:beta-glucosidase n=1 Tax=Polychaeton citri CBS 116435 TaxID=1314669 RepID=A0A9P4Q816_9PEZI|nr:glycoside hydrolase family 3 protein [Polychaeton citri CBS 116435]